MEQKRDELNEAIIAANLAKAQDLAKTVIENKSLPTEDSTNGNADIFVAIQNAKDKALADIQSANNIQEVNTAKNEGLTNLINAIKNYENNLAAKKIINAKRFAATNINLHSQIK